MKVEIPEKFRLKPLMIEKKCPFCGEINKRLAGFCKYCHGRLDAQQAIEGRKSRKDTVSSKIVIVFIILMFLIIFLSYIIFTIFR